MRQLQVRDLMISVQPSGMARTGHLESLHRTFGMDSPACPAPSKCGDTKPQPECVAPSKCGDTKPQPECVAPSKCTDTKPQRMLAKGMEDAAALHQLKATLRRMQEGASATL